MNGISKIIDRIALDAQSACDEIAAESDARVAQIKAEYAEREREIYGAGLRRGAEQGNARYERRIGAAKLEFQKNILAEKQTMLSEAFSVAVSELRALPERDYTILLTKLVCRAVRTGEETLVFSPGDLARVGKAVTDMANAALEKVGRTAKLTLSDSARDIAGGVVIVGEDVEVNCALDRLVAEYRNEVEPRVSEILF